MYHPMTKRRKTKLDHIRSVLKDNNYPVTFIKSCEDSILSSKKDVAPVNSSKSKKSADEVRIVLPYIRGISEKISRVLRSNNLQVAHRPISKMGDLFPRPKDVKDLIHKTGVVYKIKCSHCDFVYYGQTERSLKTRKAEHRRAICNNLPASKVAQHANDTGHDFDFDNMEVVDKEKNWHQRLFLEAWHSSQDSNSGNDYIRIPDIYKTLFARSSTSVRC